MLDEERQPERSEPRQRAREGRLSCRITEPSSQVMIGRMSHLQPLTADNDPMPESAIGSPRKRDARAAYGAWGATARRGSRFVLAVSPRHIIGAEGGRKKMRGRRKEEGRGKER